MANHFRKSFGRPVRTRQLLVAEADIAAARKLLLLLANADELPTRKARSRGCADAGSGNRSQIVDDAMFAFVLRQRRLKIFGESFTSEAPFAMLLTLYLNEHRDPQMSVRSLTKLAWLPYTTVVRWVDELERDGWIARNADVSDRRQVKGGLKLSDKGRAALERLFGWAEEEADAEE